MSRLFMTVLFAALVLVTSASAHDDMLDMDSTYYKVVGVAADDTLNIRADASATSASIGNFAPGAAPVEVIAKQDGWGQVVRSEGNGWVSLNYLEEIEVETIGETTLPVGLACLGTEPFWDVKFTGNETAVFSDIETETPLSMEISDSHPAAARMGIYWLKLRAGKNDQTSVLVRRDMCSDGMSDADYPYSVEILREAAHGTRALSGCCYLPSAD